MNRFLKRWAVVAPIVAACIGAGVTFWVRRESYLTSDASHETGQQAEIAALRDKLDAHLDVSAPLVLRFERWERYQVAFHEWIKVVSGIQGWPQPPDPDKVSLKRTPDPPGAGVYASELRPKAKGACP